MPTCHKHSWPILVITSILLIDFVLVIYCTRVNIGVTPDSVNYIHSARSLASGNGLMMLGEQGGTKPLAHFPPLFPIALSIPCALGLDPLVSGRWLNAFLHAVNTALVMALTHRQTRHFWGAIFAGAIFATLGPVLQYHVMLWSEPLFLTMTFLFAYCISAYLTSGRISLAVAAGIVAGSAFLARYVGASVIAAGGVLCLLDMGTGMRKKWKHLLAFAVAASVGPSVWLVRNALVAGTLTNRSIAFHPPSSEQLIRALGSICTLLPVPGRSLAIGLAIVLLGLTLLVVGSFLLFAKAPSGPLRLAERCPVLFVLLTTVGCYLLLLLVSMSLFDAATPLDGRLLGPAVALLIPAFVMLYLRVFHSVRNVPSRRMIFMVIPALLLVGSAGRAALRVHYWSENGLGGYTDATWSGSESIAEWRKVRSDVLTYTNGVDVIYLHTRSHVCRLPDKYSPYSKEANPVYGDQLAAIARQVSSGRAVVLWFDEIVWRDYLVSKKELEDLFPDKVARFSDGVLFGSPAGENKH